MGSPTNTKGGHFSHVTTPSLGIWGQTSVLLKHSQAASLGNHIPLLCLPLCIKGLLHFYSSGLIIKDLCSLFWKR